MKSLTMREAHELWEATKERSFIPTGIPALDAALGGGLPVRQITTLGAYTGQGKSDLARQFVRYAVKKGFPGKIVDIELGAARIFERNFAQETKFSVRQLKRGPENFQEQELLEEALDKLTCNELFTIKSPGAMPNADKLFASLEKELETVPRGSPMLIVFDSIQRMSLGQDVNSLREGVVEFMAALEDFAHNHDVAVVAVSEMSRAKTGGIPKKERLLTSLAEGRAIEYTSDCVLFLWPCQQFGAVVKSVIEDDEDEAEVSRECHLIIGKNRVTGKEGRVDCKLAFIKPYWGFRVLADDEQSLQEEVLAFFQNGPKTAAECIETLKKRKQFIYRILNEFARLKVLVKAGNFYQVPSSEKVLGTKRGKNAQTRSK